MADDKPRLIRLLHVARRDLQIADDTWRTLLHGLTGKSSSKDCSAAQLERVLGHLKSKGFKIRKPKAAPPRAERRPLDTSAEAKKVRAIWLFLAGIGAVRDPSEGALNAYVLRQAGVDDLRWVRDMTPVIEGLKAWAARLLPGALQARVDALKAARVLVPQDTVAAVIQRSAPTRRPDTFDALWAAWERLAIIDSVRASQ
jgi:hypothetical protein